MTWSKLSPTEKFLHLWKLYGWEDSDLVSEYPFHRPDRDRIHKWKFDFAFPSLSVFIEIDGMGYGHQSAKARVRDNRKANVAVSEGWKVLRFTATMLTLKDGQEIIDLVNRTLERAYEEKKALQTTSTGTRKRKRPRPH